MKKIGYVLSAFPVLSETFVGSEIRAIKKLGHSVCIIASERPQSEYQSGDEALLSDTVYLDQISKIRGISRFLKQSPGWYNAVKFAYTQTGISPKSLLLQGAKVAEVAKANHCDHLHAHFALQTAATAIVAAKLLNITVSFVGHGYDVYAYPSDLPLKLANSDFTAAVCKQMQKDFKHLYSEANTHLVPCGIDLRAFSFTPKTNHNGQLLFIGRLAEKKGITYLLQALHQLPPGKRPTLHIVGSGSLQSELEIEIKFYQIEEFVHFLGARDSQWIRQNASDYLGLVAPFCEATNGDKDTGPLVLKEAMALGLPVITTRFMGCIEIVDPSTGTLIPERNTKALKDAIYRLMKQTSEERLNQLLRAREKVETHFTSERQAKILSDAFQNAGFICSDSLVNAS